MALNAYSLSRCVNAERKTKKELIISRWGLFPSVFFFSLGCLSLGVIRQEREEWTSFINLKYALCALFPLLQDWPPPLLPHAEKEQNTKWMWAVENTPSQEAAVQMAVARGHQGKWKNDCPLVYSKSLIGVSTFQTVVPMLWFCDDKNWTFIIIFAEINFQNNPNKTRYWRKLKIRKWGKLQ